MKTIFVSSTFKDMHFERDAIQEITLPLLKREAQKYGDNVHFCDLRWGINTCDLDSEDGSRKVLDVCLDAIDRCRPPMVVILGDRYGWIPSEELTASVADRKNIDRQEIMRRQTASHARTVSHAKTVSHAIIENTANPVSRETVARTESIVSHASHAKTENIAKAESSVTAAATTAVVAATKAHATTAREPRVVITKQITSSSECSR